MCSCHLGISLNGNHCHSATFFGHPSDCLCGRLFSCFPSLSSRVGPSINDPKTVSLVLKMTGSRYVLAAHWKPHSQLRISLLQSIGIIGMMTVEWPLDVKGFMSFFQMLGQPRMPCYQVPLESAWDVYMFALRRGD